MDVPVSFVQVKVRAHGVPGDAGDVGTSRTIAMRGAPGAGVQFGRAGRPG